MPLFLPRAASVGLLLLLGRDGGVAYARRLLQAAPADAVMTTTILRAAPVVDAAVAASLRDAADALEAAVGAARAGPAEWDERTIEDALNDADVAMDGCHMVAKSVHEGCRGSMRALIAACSNIAGETASTKLRRHALTTLARLAVSGGIELEDLRRIFAVCERLAVLKGIPYWDVLEALDAVAQSELPDRDMLEAITTVALQLMQAVEMPKEGEERARFLFEAMAIISRFAHRIAGDVPACLGVVRAVRFVMDSTQECREYFLVRLLALNILSHRVVPLTREHEVMVEVLGVLESCANVPWDQGMLAQGSLMLAPVARHVGEAQLGRVLGVCEKMERIRGSERAVGIVVERLLASSFSSGSEARFQLLARSFAIQERSKVPSLKCGSALRLLHDLQPQETPPFHAALRRRAAAQAAPSLELALYVDEFVPLPPESLARSEIVDACARDARQRPKGSALRELLHAACLRPRRVGRHAAAAVAALAEEAEDSGLSSMVEPEDIATVGDCLGEAFEAPDSSSSRFSSSGGYLRNFDAAAAAEIAGVILSAAASITRGWTPDRRFDAVEGLCALTGGVHAICRAPA